MEPMRLRSPLLPAALACAALTPCSEAGSLAPGQKIAPFALPQADGSRLDLAAVAGRKAYVLAFVSSACPVSTAYDARLFDFAREYSERGAATFAIHSGRDESAAVVAEHARKSGFAFPALRDEGNRKADELGVLVTPEVFVFDAEWTLRYRGRIDEDTSGSAVPAADLKAAVDAVLAGREVRLKQTKAFGCTIRRLAAGEPVK